MKLCTFTNKCGYMYFSPRLSLFGFMLDTSSGQTVTRNKQLGLSWRSLKLIIKRNGVCPTAADGKGPC